jgi:hypothetical protein
VKTFDVTIKGVTPLLMNRFPDVGEFDSKLKVNNPNIDGKEKALEKVYSLDGKPYQPSTHIWRALTNAGKDLRVKGKGKATYSKMIASMVCVQPDAIMHKIPKFDIFSCLTVNPNTGNRCVTHRPRFSKWELDFQLLVDDEIPTEVLKEALDRAGKYVGIGDWRPDRKGVHGKFIVTRFEETEG